MIKKPKQTIKSAAYGSNAQGERNNCTVRALANCGFMTYVEADALMKSYGRKPCHGLTMDKVFEAYKDAGLEYLGYYGDSLLARACS